MWNHRVYWDRIQHVWGLYMMSPTYTSPWSSHLSECWGSVQVQMYYLGQTWSSHHSQDAYCYIALITWNIIMFTDMVIQFSLTLFEMKNVVSHAYILNTHN
jgi:hypothetical protein